VTASHQLGGDSSSGRHVTAAVPRDKQDLRHLGYSLARANRSQSSLYTVCRHICTTLKFCQACWVE
jgi:hypothetical protein